MIDTYGIGALMPSRRLRARFLREVQRVERATCHARAAMDPHDLPDPRALPDPAQRCLLFSGDVGRAQVRSVRAHAMGRLRLGKAEPWMHCEVWQYVSSPPITRVGAARLRSGESVPSVMEDGYVDGEPRAPRQLVRLTRLDPSTTERFAVDELVHFLSDAVLSSPAMLLSAPTRWTAVDDRSFDVELTDHQRVARVRVSVDERGAVIRVDAERLFATMPGATDAVPELPPRPGAPARPKVEWRDARWSTFVTDWGRLGSRRFARCTRAVWQLPEGELPYATLTFDEVDLSDPEVGVCPAGARESEPRDRPARPGE